MNDACDKSERSTLSLTPEARASLVASSFTGRDWCLTAPIDSVIFELLAVGAIRETKSGAALTSIGMSMKAISSRLLHRQRSSQTGVAGEQSR
jgi:hypothetical protein